MQQGELTSALMHANGILSERYDSICYIVASTMISRCVIVKASLDAVIKFVSYSSCLEAWAVEGTGGITEDGETIIAIHKNVHVHVS